MARSEIEEKIMDYALDEGILGKKLPKDPKLEFGYELNFPPNSPRPLKIILIKPAEKKAVAFQIATQIAKEHITAINKVDPQGLFKFFTIFKKFCLTQNLLFNIDIKNARYIISDSIYPDGLTENNFYQTIRKVFNAAMFMNTYLMELMSNISGKGKNKDLKSLDDMEFSGNDSMFS